MISVGQVFQGTVPARHKARSVLIRVIQVHAHTVQLRVTALPNSPRIAANRRRFWVTKIDLETMIATGLATPLRKLPCPSCGSAMQLYNGYKGKQAAVMFACNQCEEQLEI